MAKDSEAGGFAAKDYHDPPPAPLIDVEEFTQWSFYRAIIAEFIATLLFLYVTVLTVIGYSSQSDVDHGGHICGGVGILGIAWAFGGMIFVLVYCTAGISGEFYEISVEISLWVLVGFSNMCSSRFCRWAYQSSGDIWVAFGTESVVGEGRFVYGGSVCWSHLWMCVGQIVSEGSLQSLRRWSQFAS